MTVSSYPIPSMVLHRAADEIRRTPYVMSYRITALSVPDLPDGEYGNYDIWSIHYPDLPQAPGEDF